MGKLKKAAIAVLGLGAVTGVALMGFPEGKTKMYVCEVEQDEQTVQRVDWRGEGESTPPGKCILVAEKLKADKNRESKQLVEVLQEKCCADCPGECFVKERKWSHCPHCLLSQTCSDHCP